MVEAMLVIGSEFGFTHLVEEALDQFEETFSENLTLVNFNNFPSGGFYLDGPSCMSDVLVVASRYGVTKSLPAIYFHILIQDGFPVSHVPISSLCMLLTALTNRKSFSMGAVTSCATSRRIHNVP
jgi:hypothetical protein